MTLVHTVWITLVAQVAMVMASVGDRSWIFQKCLRSCEGKQCSRMSDEAYAASLPCYLRWLRWSCTDNCNYDCMWKTVEAFQMDASNVPQFYGKWPFIRLLGVQEPASATFSFLNGVSHVIMLMTVRRKVPSSAPMYFVWHMYALVAVNAWFWATVFHTRDTIITEMMDYISAVALVMFSLLAFFVRALGPNLNVKVTASAVALLAFFSYHIHYLAFVKFDYGYNMNVNIVVGILNVLGWVSWSYKSRNTQPYVWKISVSVLLISSLVLLELGDFPPLFWTFDAHSLWHAGTAPIPILWYSFVIDDCLYLLAKKQKLKQSELPPATQKVAEKLNLKSTSDLRQR